MSVTLIFNQLCYIFIWVIYQIYNTIYTYKGEKLTYILSLLKLMFIIIIIINIIV